MYDVLLLLVIVLTIWSTVNYIYVNYYKNRPDYFLPTPERIHYSRNAFRTGLDLRDYPSPYAPAIITIDREAPVELLFRSRPDRSGHIWYQVRYYSNGRFHTGWVPALYLH